MHGRVNAVLDPVTKCILEQTPMPPFEAVAYGAGGAGGAAEVGAVTVLEETGIRKQVKYVSGVSVGSLVGLCDALGYTAAEITQLFLEMPMDEFMPMSESWQYTPAPLATVAEGARTMMRFRSQATIEGQKKFLAWVQNKIVAPKFGNGEATNFDLDAKIADDMSKTGRSDFKKLYVGVTNVGLEIPKFIVFGSDSERKIGLAQMIIMSACHPYLWGAVEWDNEWWSDGGILQLELMNHFDKPHFHPVLFGGMKVNPSVLAFKIFSPRERDQLICGKKFKDPVKSASHLGVRVVTGALYNASDPSEEHRPLNIVALSDGGIDRVKMNHSKEKLLELIEAGKTDTRHYLENRLGWAQITSHRSMAAWLAASTTNIGAVKRAYLAMLAKLSASTEKEDVEKCKAICKQVNFLEEYRRQSEEKDHWDGEGLEFPPHIDIPPEKHTAVWHAAIEASLNERLAAVRKKIECFEQEYQFLCARHTERINEVFPENANYGWRSEEALQLLLCEEYLESLRVERDDLLLKLNLKRERQFVDVDEVGGIKTNYELFHKLMRKFNKNETDNEDVKAINLPDIPFLLVKEGGAAPFSFQLDMRRKQDRQLYMIAAMIFMTYQKSYELEKFKKNAETFVPNIHEAISSLGALITALDLQVIEVHPCLFKLEALLHHFESKRYPRYAPVLNVDTLYKLPGGSFFAKPTKPLAVSAMAVLKPREWIENQYSEIAKREAAIEHEIKRRESLQQLLADYFNMTGESYLHGEYESMIQQLVACDEFIRQLQIECEQIKCQLRLSDQSDKTMSVFDKQLYATMYFKMVELNADPGLSYGLRAVMPLSLPIEECADEHALPFSFILKFNADEFEDDVMPVVNKKPFKFYLDLRDARDRKLYFIASLIYLEYRNYADTERFIIIFQIVTGAAASPRSMKELMEQLGCDQVEAQLAMVRIECLLHYFDRKFYNNPAYQSLLSLDDLWGLPKLPTQINDERLKEQKRDVASATGIALKSVYSVPKPKVLPALVAPMSAYTNNHEDVDDDDEEFLAEKSWSTRLFSQAPPVANAREQQVDDKLLEPKSGSELSK